MPSSPRAPFTLAVLCSASQPLPLGCELLGLENHVLSFTSSMPQALLMQDREREGEREGGKDGGREGG